MNAFERYAPFIQEFIYRSGWTALRGVQNAAAEAIFGTEDHVLLCASTASGKTEAAFFPILSLLEETPARSVGVLYIAPLKALINDQFGRLTELCREAEIPVTRWHGDAAQSQKRKLLRQPAGILQITPESLESLLINKHAELPGLFCDLRFIVIDELHALLRGDRGLQCFCLIQRLCRAAGCAPRRIGLSATIGDPAAAGRFLAAGSERGTVIPRFEAGKERWRLSLAHFYNSPPQAGEDDPARRGGHWPPAQGTASEREQSQFVSAAAAPTGADPARRGGHWPPAQGTASQREQSQFVSAAAAPTGADPARRGGHWPPAQGTASQREQSQLVPAATAPGDPALLNADPGLAYIFEHSRGRKCLIFTNSREECEGVCQSLRQYCEAKGEPERFLIHHGNLSASYRESAEEEMKDDDSLLSVCATATLELGIDVGRLERAFQIDAPFTVSGFLQRMGRTGRRGAPSELWFVMREEHQEARAMLPETIPWQLIQGAALVQLYIEERFVEPPRLDRLPYSLLYHQTMSTLAAQGEMSPGELASRVLPLSCFRRVSREDYRLLLRHLMEIDHINPTENGGLIVGITGERIVSSHKFYAVFQENVEYTVHSGSEQLGTIVKPPPVGDRIAIAGRVWAVDAVDHQRREVECTLVKGKIPAYFGDVPGDIHTRILERMYGVLREDGVYPYLLPQAAARLAEARESFRRSGMARRPLVPLGGKLWALFPWLGTYAFLALERFLKLRCGPRLGLRGLNSARPYWMQFSMEADEAAFYQIVAEEAARDFDPLSLLYPKEVPVFEKYDEYVPPELIRKGFAESVLDLSGMKQRILSWQSR